LARSSISPDGSAARAFAAVDLGAESGRVVLGRFDGRAMSLEVVHRFPNRPVRLPDGLHWNLLELFAQTLDGLARAAGRARLDGVGVDAWGVDYALLDGALRLTGLPYHYRDGRTQGMAARVHERVSREELYAVTGIQMLPINTIFQLMAERGGAALRCAERIALVPDLFGLWLSGDLANEITAASTTGLLDARSGVWAHTIVERLGYPAAPFAGGLTPPATALGPVQEAHGSLAGVPVWTVAGHDTASAFAAAPLRDRGGAVLSSGTWSLLGLEVQEPLLGVDAAAANLTNERGLDGTVRLLCNVMGLWLVEECRRAWSEAGAPCEHAELLALAAAASPDVALFDPDHESLLAPGGMPDRIAARCRAAGQAPPAGPGETARAIFVSLACKYRVILERLARVSGCAIEVLHVVGGGARNPLLCQLTADLTRVPVLAGPVEATALGNALVQARAAGELGASLAELREVASASAETIWYDPGEDAAAAATYARFLAVTGLSDAAPAAAGHWRPSPPQDENAR
jgi:rhamnulokinase